MGAEETGQAMTEVQAIEVEMKRLQCEKLRAEIRDISLSWWQRSGYIASMAPIVLAIAGVFSAWASGFFNRERSKLQADIVQLTGARAKLEKETEKAQQELTSAKERAKHAQNLIDEVFLKVSFHSFGSRYALGHVMIEAPGDWSGVKEIDKAESTVKQLKELADADRRHLDRVFEEFRIALDMINAVKASMKSVEKLLSQIPASERVKRVQINPDGFFDTDMSKSYSIENIGEFLKSAE